MDSGDGPDKEELLLIDAFVQRFEKAWQNGDCPAIDDFLPQHGPDRLAVLIELVNVDMEWRRRKGDPVRPDYYRERYPELAAFTNSTQVHELPLKKQIVVGP